MVTESKIAKVKSLREKISKAKSIVVAEYHGVDANQINELRQRLKDEGNEMTVAKNTLLKVALNDEKINTKELEKHMEGPNATIFAYEDSISPIKIIAEFAKKLGLPKIKAAIVDGVFTSAEKADELSILPSKQELLAQVVYGMKSPITGFVNVLGGTQQKFARVINAIKENREQGV